MKADVSRQREITGDEIDWFDLRLSGAESYTAATYNLRWV